MSEEGKIRPAVLGDLDRIVTLEKTCFPRKLVYNRRQLRYLLLHAHSTVLLETHNKITRGFVIVLYRKGTSVAGIETIDVDPVYRNQGIGQRLLTAAEEDIRQHGKKKIRLEVAKNNEAAIALYKNAGFKTTVLLKNYYVYNHGGSRDALRMIKEVS
jgi:ribosomal protein S18 acetylase RimI-like enzyme